MIVIRLVLILAYGLLISCLPVEKDGKTILTKLQPIPNTKIYYHSSVIKDKSMYVFGGQNIPNPYYGALWEYKLDQNSWIKISDGPGDAPIYHHSVILSDSIYILGGSVGGAFLEKVWEYNLNTKAWTNKVPIPYKPGGSYPEYAGVTVYNNKIYHFGGRGSNNVYSNQLWVYDPTANSWSRLADGPATEMAYIVPYNNKLILYSSMNKKMWTYDFVTNQWSFLFDAPYSITQFRGLLFNDTIYFCGGAIDNKDYGPGVIVTFNLITHQWTLRKNFFPIYTSLATSINYFGGMFLALEGDQFFAISE